MPECKGKQGDTAQQITMPGESAHATYRVKAEERKRTWSVSLKIWMSCARSHVSRGRDTVREVTRSVCAYSSSVQSCDLDIQSEKRKKPVRCGKWLRQAADMWCIRYLGGSSWSVGGAPAAVQCLLWLPA